MSAPNEALKSCRVALALVAFCFVLIITVPSASSNLPSVFMQASLDANSLKALTRALTCISKFGDDLTIVAGTEKLSLCATNSSMSAYCCFKYDRQFFTRYRVNVNADLGDASEDAVHVSGQVLVKSLLSILKHRTVEKSVDRCEFTIVEGVPSQDQDTNRDHDSLESKLIVRLHCKHGVVKTHKLLLLNATLLTAPSVPDDYNESKLTIGSRAVREMLEHFPIARGPKSDPQIVWSFRDEEVILKGLDSSLDTSVKGQLSTELTISAAEFEIYDIFDPPVTISFHLREFLATIAFAESSSTSLDMRFTDPAAPLFIDLDGDLVETLFVIATSQVLGAPPPARETPQRGMKRERDADSVDVGVVGSDPRRSRSVSTVSVPTSARKVKPMKAAVRVDRVSLARELQGHAPNGASVNGSMPPPSFVPLPSSLREQSVLAHDSISISASMLPPATHPPSLSPHPPARTQHEPLFLPSSQVSIVHLSQAAGDAIRESGLGIEGMDAAEFLDMLEGEGEEVNFVPASQAHEQEMDMSMTEEDVRGDRSHIRESDTFEIYEGDEETQLGPTQNSSIQSSEHSRTKAFRPLFDD